MFPVEYQQMSHESEAVDTLNKVTKKIPLLGQINSVRILHVPLNADNLAEQDLSPNEAIR